MNDIISHKLKELPTNSGVYLMLDENNEIIYVGKAVNLKNRVHQYFYSSGNKTEKTIQLVKNIADFRYIITDNEVDALVLENNLIKRYTPKYNILLKDDKSYPFIKIDLKQKFPTIEIVRKLKADGAKYFGPYMQGINSKEVTDLIYSAFPLRACKKDLERLPPSHRPCLNMHIGRCFAPCVGGISESDYAVVVKNVIDFLKGNDSRVKETLEQKMADASNRQDYESAIYYRDRLKALEKLVRRQISELPKNYNMDIFSVADNGAYSAVSVLVVRGGKLLGGDNYPLTNTVSDVAFPINKGLCEDERRRGDTEPDDELTLNMLSQFLLQYYAKTPSLPDEIVTGICLPDAASIEKLLSETYGKTAVIVYPKQGVRKQLADMAANNASDFLETFIVKKLKKYALTEGATGELQKCLQLKKPPIRTECYDISHISGTDKVASMTVFISGEAAHNMYRRFKIKTVEGNNDFACMKEVLTRRFQRLGAADCSFGAQPDLIVVDGGRGQLRYAVEAMKESGVDFPIVAIAERDEELYVPNNPSPIILSRRSAALKLVQRIRDEAHRFAVEYHRKLRTKRMAVSELKAVGGIGDKKIAALFEKFRTISNIKSASREELGNVKGISLRDADNIIGYFSKKEK